MYSFDYFLIHALRLSLSKGILLLEEEVDDKIIQFEKIIKKSLKIHLKYYI
jgi:hypothetical protein